MMILILFIFILVFVGIFIFLTRKIILSYEQQAQEEISEDQEIYEMLLKRKEQMVGQRTFLKGQVDRIFALYEMTEEITQELSQQEAFYVFRSKLRDHVALEDCQWHEEEFEEPVRIPEDKFFFPLKGYDDTFGYLSFTGVYPPDKEKIIILSYQFVLALRRIRFHQKIEKIAISDYLTGVYSRRYFLERFEEEIKRAKLRKINLSFLMLDVDFFKSFNDSYGHLTGDQILKEIGGIIKASIREIDIAGRYGGEEFCVVLPETDTEGALLAAERIRLAVEKTPIKAYDTTIQVTVSIGVATMPVHASTTTELLDKADWALYRAKKSGRNRVCAFGVYV